jgi:hypothetical protein
MAWGKGDLGLLPSLKIDALALWQRDVLTLKGERGALRYRHLLFTAAQCCACLSPTPTFQPITIPIRLNLDPISSRICSASAVEHPDPQLLTPSQDNTSSGLAAIQLSRIFPTPLWVPHQKKASEKRKGKKNQARQRQAKRRHSQSEYSTGSSLSSPSIYLPL